MNRLEFLLQRYKNNTATPEEVEELSGLMDGAFKGDSDQVQLSETGEEDLQSIFRKLDSVPLAQPTRIVRFKRSTTWLAAAAVVTLAVVATALLTTDIFNHQPPSAGSDMVAYTGKQLVQLPDGSTVLLNENSELKVGKDFGSLNREVSFVGEGYFKVAHDPSKPFIVHTGKVNTKVLGTVFNIKAYPNESAITVTVTKGKVQVSDDQRTFGIITPNEQIAVNTATDEFVKSQVDSQNVILWQANYFILDNVTFAEAAILIEKRFNVKVIIVNEALKECVVSAWFFNNEDLPQIVDDLSTLKQATSRISNDSVIIEGGAGCKTLR